MVLEEEDLEEGNIQQLKTNMELKAISRSNTSVRGTTRVGFANKTHQRQQLARQDVQEVVHVDVSRHIADRAVGQSKQREAGGLDRPRRTCGEQSAEEQLQCIADRSANGRKPEPSAAAVCTEALPSLKHGRTWAPCSRNQEDGISEKVGNSKARL